MLILRKLSGIAVLLLALHFVHVMHRFVAMAPHDDPWFWVGMVVSGALDILSFVGSYFLLRS